MGLFKKDFKNKNLIVLDIGTQFIKALMMEVDKDKAKGIIHAWTKESFCDEKNKSIIESEKTFYACQKAIKNLLKKTGKKTEEVFLGIGSDILKGKTTSLCYRRDNPDQNIDLSELKYLIQKIQWRAFDEIRKELSQQTDFLDSDARLVNAHIVDIKVDGHSISDPIGFRGSVLCLSVFNTYTALQYWNNLGKFISALGLKIIGVSPLAYALFHCLDLEKSSKGDVLVVDIGSRTTEVILIKNGGEIIEAKNFYLGGWVFSKVLADFLGINPEEAEMVKTKYIKGELSLEAKKKIEKLFMPHVSSWLNGIRIVMDDFLKGYKSLPSKIFLCGGSCNLPLIESELKRNKNLKIHYISPLNIVKIENRTKFQEIPTLALANLYLDLPEEKNILAFTLKRIMRLIQS